MKFVFNDGGRSNYFKADNVGDCGVRAVANATGLDYKKVYDDLKSLNKGKSCRDGTPRKVMAKYMEQLGWKWTPTMGIGTGCKVHLREDELPKGNLVLSLSGHFSCVRDGVLYDTYDCSRGGTRCVYGYWRESAPKKSYRLTDDDLEEIYDMQSRAFNILMRYTALEADNYLIKGMQKVDNALVDMIERMQENID